MTSGHGRSLQQDKWALNLINNEPALGNTINRVFEAINIFSLVFSLYFRFTLL